jgi:hypothetical protein
VASAAAGGVGIGGGVIGDMTWRKRRSKYVAQSNNHQNGGGEESE